MNTNTGGPAFPAHGLPGMDLRDYFAAKALPTVSSYWMKTDDPFQDNDVAEIIARDCYIVADAMLKARG